VTDGTCGPDLTTGRLASLLLTGFCHPFDRVFDRVIGGVRKLKGGPGDVNPTAAASIFRAERRSDHRGHYVDVFLVVRSWRSVGRW
jgi:hypothetical protein